jgi:hypothetical protein
MRLLTVVVLCRGATCLQAETVTVVSDAVSPSRNRSIEFQKFMVSLRITKNVPGRGKRDWSTLEDHQQFVQIPMGA